MPLEVVVEGEATAGGFASRTSTDTAPRETLDTADLVEGLPSVHVRRLGGDGSFSAITVRGAASGQIGVVLAGIPLVSAGDPAADIAAIPTWPSATVRVYRGFAPARLGTTGYLGGLLAIDPPSAAAGPRTESWLAAGSFGALKLRVGDVRRAGDLGIATAVTASRSDGDFDYELLDERTDRFVARTRTNAGHESVAGLARLTIHRRWGHVGATMLADARRAGLPGPADAPTEIASLETSRGLLGLDTSVRTSATGAWHTGLWTRFERAELSDPRRELDPTARRDRAVTRIHTVGGSVGWRGRPVDSLTFDQFVDGRIERLVPAFDGSAASAQRVALGLGADAQWRASDRLVVALAARLDGRVDRAAGVLGPSGSPAQEPEEIAPSAHAGVAYRLARAATIALHAGARQRPPSFLELFGDRGALLGNAGLAAERSTAIDAGVGGSVDLDGLAVGYEAVAFASVVRDLIAFVQVGRGTFRPDNVAEARLAGGELTLSTTTGVVRTKTTYTLVHTENLGSDPTARHAPLPGRPAHDLAYDAALSLGPGGISQSIDLVAGNTVDVAGTTELPPRFLFGAGAWLDVPRVEGLRLALQVDNMLDARTMWLPSPLTVRGIKAFPVSDFLGFPLPGRTIWFTVRHRMDGP